MRRRGVNGLKLKEEHAAKLPRAWALNKGEAICDDDRLLRTPALDTSSRRELAQSVGLHDHVCLIYETYDEWRDAVVSYLVIGLERREKCIAITSDKTERRLRKLLRSNYADTDKAETSGQLVILPDTKAYAATGQFDPDRMIAFLVTEAEKAVKEGYEVLRLTGALDCLAAKNNEYGKLFEFETKLNSFFAQYPCIGLCQYNREKFGPKAIKSAILTHPLMMRNGHIHHNLYCLSSEELQAKNRVDIEVQRWLENIEIQNVYSRQAGILAKVLYGSSQPFVVCRYGGSVVSCNRAFSSLVGYTEQELQSTNLANDGFFSRVAHAIDKIGRTWQPQRFESECVRKDGIRVPVYVTIEAPEDDRGDGPDYYCFVTDITDRRTASDRIGRVNRLYSVLSRINEAIVRIREPERLYEEACRIAVDVGLFRMACVWLVDQEARELKPIVYWGAEDGYLDGIKVSIDDVPEGRGPAGTAARECRYSVCGDIQADVRMAPWRTEAVKRGYASVAAFPIKVEDRTVGVLALYAHERGFFKHDEVRLLELLVADISFAIESIEEEQKRKQAEKALSASENKYRELVQGIQEGVWVIDAEDTTTFVNPRMAAMLGYAPEDMVGQTLLPFVDPREVAHVKHRIARRRQGISELGERVLLHKDGHKVHASMHVTPLLDENNNYVGALAFIVDITKQKQLEAQLRQSQRLEAIGTLTGGIAHEFRNLLMAISGYAEMIQMKLGREHPESALADELLQCVDRGSKLTGQLLAFSKQQLIEVHPVDLIKLVADAKSLFGQLLGSDITLELKLDAERAVAEVDSGQIEQVLLNLLVNARDAMPNGGILTIGVSKMMLTQSSIEGHDWVDPGEYIELSVSDTGVGMDEETVERIFEPFFSTKTAKQRAGLGLAVAYGIVKQHNGHIHVTSSIGVGTTFRVFLPAVESDPADVDQTEVVRPSHGKETILLAEDEESVRTPVRTILQKYGYTVLCASNGKEALELFKLNRDHVSIAILDLVMPGIGGERIWQEISQDRPDLKGIFMSGHRSGPMPDGSKLPDGVPMLSKPFSLFQLVQVVRELLDQPAKV